MSWRLVCGKPTKFNENQRDGMLALKEKVASFLYVGDRPPRPLLHKARHITICSSSSNSSSSSSSSLQYVVCCMYHVVCIM